jgi:tetratricopeptide (TPR) repeat protein
VDIQVFKMRHSSNRSAIYIVIGIGLLILTVSQFRRGDEASNASYVANSSPFEALQDYQPSYPLAEIGHNPIDDGVANVEIPVVSAPAIAPDDVSSALPEILPTERMQTGLEETDLAESGSDFTAHFMNTPKEIEMPAAPADVDESYFGLEVGLDDSQEPQPMPIDELAFAQRTVEPTEQPGEPADSNEFAGSINLANVETVRATLQAPAIDERTSTDMPAFSSIGKNQNRRISNPLASPSGSSESAKFQNTAWKKNPFATGDTMTSPAAEPSTLETSATEKLDTDTLVAEDLAETFKEAATVASFEPTTEPAATASLATMAPSVDHTTMRSVISPTENVVADSPSIQIGISQADAQKAVHNIEYGKSLSRRGAAYAARQEFYSSLRILAQSHDKQAGGTAYTQALRSGIVAIKEAQDFVVTDTEAQIGLRVSNVIETHSTKIITAQAAQGMTAIEAAQRYFAYASHQLARCGGQNVVAAEALYCLGKLHSVQAKSGSNHSKLDMAKSMIYHQAAITADASNFRSLNELGVLYANSGRFDESKQMLKNSLRINALPQAWQNLAVIHQRMGEHQLAQLANREFEMVSTQAPNSAIRWAPIEEFNKNAPLVQHTASQASALLPAPAEADAGNSNLKSLGNRILDSIR